MPSKAEFIDGAVVSIGMLLMIFAAKFLPEGAIQTIVIALGFIVVLADAVIIELLFELVTMHYPYLRVELQPSGTILHAYLERGYPKTVDITNVLKASTFKAHWDMNHTYYGRFKEFVIHHEFDLWGKRIIPKKGWAVFMGYAIPHPQVAKVVCHEYSYASDRYKDLPIPAFQLAYAHGGDVQLLPPALTTTLVAMKEVFSKHPEAIQQGVSLDRALSLMRHYDAMTFAYAEANREAQYWRSETLRLDKGEESKDSQTKGLLKLQTDVTKRAWEFMFGLHDVHGSIANIIKHHKRSWGLLLNKYTAIVLISAMALVGGVYLAINPDVRMAAGQFFSSLQNQAMIVILATCIVAVLYFLRGRRK